jgi:hypothetical protein
MAPAANRNAKQAAENTHICLLPITSTLLFHERLKLLKSLRANFYQAWCALSMRIQDYCFL